MAKLRVGARVMVAVALLAGPQVDLARTAGRAGAATAGQATAGSDVARTGWYPDQSGLSPNVVAGGTFGRLFNTALTGKVYAQPLVANGTLVTASETNDVYGLDPVTGAVKWHRNVGVPFDSIRELGCGDASPTVGVTSTPVVDKATSTVYLVSKRYIGASTVGSPVGYFMEAMDTSTGVEQAGFPVPLAGTADNNPAVVFNAHDQLQRPGLLLLGGVVYAGFGSQCDYGIWGGWIFGVPEGGTTVSARWVDRTATTHNNAGGGIWQSGGGLVSDGAGRILFNTGNANNPVPRQVPGNQAAAIDQAESVVRLGVGTDGKLTAADFFSPYDAPTLDANDMDVGSGAPVALPAPYFGTPAIPNLAVAVGKEGYVYLLNRDSLGGQGQGQGGADAVVGRYGPNGGVWSSVTTWPGDGGYVYVPTASGNNQSFGSSGHLTAYKYALDGTGQPTLSLAATSAEAFGFQSSAAQVTSDGTISGSALLWTVWSPPGDPVGAQLRAYDAVPVNGDFRLRWSDTVGVAAKWAPPGIANGRVYVATGDDNGHIIGYGAPNGAPLNGNAVAFGGTIIGTSSAPATATFTATTAVTVSALSVSGVFTIGTSTPALPVTLASGQAVSVPVTFSPTSSGSATATLTATTNLGVSGIGVTGTGQATGKKLSASTKGVSFGGVTVGAQLTQGVTLSNTGSPSLTISTVTAPISPFQLTGAPLPGAVLAPGASMVVTASFSPTAAGPYTSSFTVSSDGGNQVVVLTGTATQVSVLTVTPVSGQVPFGSVAIGSQQTQTFQLTNVGGSDLTITKSKPPVVNGFQARTALAEGSTIAAGQSITEAVTFSPPTIGAASSAWIVTASDSQGPHTLTFTGTGTDAGSGGGGISGWTPWQARGAPPPGIVGAPAVASWTPGRLDVLARGGDNSLWHRFQVGVGTWSAWENLGGQLTADPAAVSWANGRIDVFVRGTDSQLWHKWWDATNWSGWQPLGGVLTSAPAVASWASGRLDVVVKGSDQAVYHLFWAGSWSGWERRGNLCLSDPGAISWGTNTLDIFCLGGTSTSGPVWHQWWRGAGWSNWAQEVPGSWGQGIGASSWSPGRIDLFGVDAASNALAHDWWDGTSWSSEILDGVLASKPAAVAHNPHHIDVFVLGTDGQLYQKTFDG